MNTGIYKIENIVTGHFYIGQSNYLDRRKHSHWSALRKNSYGNVHLQNAWNKYGERNFRFIVILFCESFELTRYEQELVDRLKPSYNARKICVDSNIGIKRSDEIKEKFSRMRKGKKFTSEHKRKISEALLGKTFSEQRRKNMSEAHKGHHPSEETRKKQSELSKGEKSWMFGKHRSEETKRKLSISKMGKNNYWFGKHHSEETKRKISISGIKAWEKRYNR